MAVVYIGDRSVGKTCLAIELANPQNDYVQVSASEYESFKFDLYFGKDGKKIEQTREFNSRELEVHVRLPSGDKTLSIDWIDTPGEIWRKTWQVKNTDDWNNFLKTVRQSQGILLILEPYRDMVNPDVDRKKFITKQQWRNRFKRWINFFIDECSNARRLAICLNKADLFCDIKEESERLQYKPSGSTLTWDERYNYVLRKYFKPIQKDIQQLTRNNYNLSVSCFITTIYNRKLLELPWIYLGAYLN
ncbi:MAG: hypothetical protein QNJ55_25515 [Xenococcus sp. MO_188.B8]|nr:hypothetical protein [Xenococcus sp. MO_188.B8]